MFKLFLAGLISISALAQDTWTRYACVPYCQEISGAKGEISGWKLVHLRQNGSSSIKTLFDNRDTFWEGSDPNYWLRGMAKDRLSESVVFHLSGDRDTFGRATDPTDVEVDMHDIKHFAYRIKIKSGYYKSEVYVPWVGLSTGLTASLTSFDGFDERVTPIAMKLNKRQNVWYFDLDSRYPPSFAQAIFLIVESLSSLYSKHPGLF